MSANKSSQSDFEQLVTHYLQNCSKIRNTLQTRHVTPEMEIRFGTNPKVAKPISIIDYNNVVNNLLSSGWTSTTHNMEGVQMLRIIPERTVTDDEKKGGGGTAKTIMSSIRAEIEGAHNIRDYCQHNDLGKLSRKIKFTKKKRVVNEVTNKLFEMIDFSDFNCRASYVEEEEYNMVSTYMPIKQTIHDWTSTKKIFRNINRVRLEHPDYAVFVDISIVKTNKKSSGKFGKPLPADTIQESEVFLTVPIYEIELELNNSKFKKEPSSIDVQNVIKQIKQCIRFILSGLQETPYPIPYSEHETVLDNYMCRLFGESWMTTKKPAPYFIGPQSVALQLENLTKLDEKVSTNISILKNYTVTEKADGLRALLYISKTGRVYMISSNLKVMFTGSHTKEKNCWDSILDGEFIMHGKQKQKTTMLFTFAAFDIYYFGGMGDKFAHVRHLPFSTNDESALEDKFRLRLLQKFHLMCKLEPVNENQTCQFKIRCKHFEQYIEDKQSITEACSSVWSKTYDYEIDGLIFTPMNDGVGGSKPNEAFELNGRKFNWIHSFKWKPPHYNTIDFLVNVQKDKDGQDLIRYIAHSGDNIMKTMIPYKTLILNVGFDKKKHKHMNVFHDVLYDNDDYFTKLDGGDENTSGYEAMPFVPTTPYDPEAYLCYIELEPDDSEKLRMKTLEGGQVFHEDMIVEFQYAKDDDKKDGPWKWVPLRVRQDKTQSLREGQKSMNNYTTADSNWRSIHFPVTEKMITGKETIPYVEVNDAIYYNLTEKTNSTTIGLRDFHNIYVKRKLINGVSSFLHDKMHIADVMLIDFSVGKGGDLAKWAHSKIRFVLGIDIHGDNITNSEDGACVRYLRWRHKNKNHPLRALFMEGNSSLNIRTQGTAFHTLKDKEIVQSVFGNGKNNNNKNYVFKHGIAADGFHISSCQFSLHYFFENTKTLHSFLQNISECTRLHGYFIGTCFDGKKIFEFLYKRKNGVLILRDESIRIDKNGRKMFEITKKYDSKIEEFKPDETSVGLSITVYQESIDKVFTEYLVHFEYFIKLMEDYGFVLILKDEAKSMGLNEGSGLFNQMFASMKQDIHLDPDLSREYRTAPNMTFDEKTVSFLNRYFVFKKMRNLSQPNLALMRETILESEQSALDMMNNEVTDNKVTDNVNEVKDNEVKDKNVVNEVKDTVNDKDNEKGPKKQRRKLKNTNILLSEENYSPIKLVLETPELQAFYDTMSDTMKLNLAKLPIRDQRLMVKTTFNRKNKT